MFRFLLILVCCSVTVSAWARGDDRISVDYNTHRPGNDYVNFRIYSVQECIDSCANDTRCVAFDYINSDRRCWLKDNVPASGRNSNAISGVKEQYRKNGKKNGKKNSKKNSGKSGGKKHDTYPDDVFVVDGIRIERGYQRAYGDYTSYSALNAKQCASDCADDYRCQAFDFNRYDKTCWLKDRVTPAKRNRDVISGVKTKGYGNRHHDNRYDNRYGNSRNNGGKNNTQQDQVAGMQLYPNVKRNGGDYKTFTVNNVQECARACAGDKHCQSFNYGKQRRDCWLKNFVPNGISNNTVISGVKGEGRR